MGTATINKDLALRAMRVLDDNYLNFAQTAKEIGVHKNTIRNWKDKFWEEYMGDKLGIGDNAHKIEAMRLHVVTNLSDAMEKINEAFGLAVKEAISILSDEEKIKKLNPKDLVQLINVLSPYVAEKKSIIGLREPDSKKTQYNQFITNIMNNHNRKIKASFK